MIPVNTKVVPDLLYYTEKYVINSTANKYKIPFPAAFEISFLASNRSFIRLLFDEDWTKSFTYYRYLFRLETCMNSAPSSIKSRMMLYPETSGFYICDSDDHAICNLNIFELQSDDLMMLDKLLQYRIDSTNVSIVSIVYDDLTTVLSKLIYIYLNFKINRDYSLFDTSAPLSTTEMVLENFYESYLVDTIFISISNQGT